jgi:outer membrane protein TolC
LGTNVDRYFDSAANRVQGADIQGSVTYTWDFANQEAKAKLAEAQISGKRAQEADAAMNRSIGSEVITAMGELQASRGALAQAGLAQAGLQQVRSDAQDRLSGGEGVINDVLTAEMDLSNAELATIEARTRYALAVARLRYVTGTLLGYDPGHPSLERSNLVTPPQP